MSKIFYNGIPIEQIDFREEFEKEFESLINRINNIKTKKNTNEKFNYQYWTMKLNRANKALEVGEVTLS